MDQSSLVGDFQCEFLQPLGALRFSRHTHFLRHPINVFLGGFLGWFDLPQQVTGARDSQRHVDESSKMDET